MPTGPYSAVSRSRAHAKASACRLKAATTNRQGTTGRGSAMVCSSAFRRAGPDRLKAELRTGNSFPQLLFLQEVLQPRLVGVADGGGRIALIVDLGGEAALVKGAAKRRVQIEHRLAIVGGQRQAEARQPRLLQRRRINLVTFRLDRPRHGHGVIPV